MTPQTPLDALRAVYLRIIEAETRTAMRLEHLRQEALLTSNWQRHQAVQEVYKLDSLERLAQLIGAVGEFLENVR